MKTVEGRQRGGVRPANRSRFRIWEAVRAFGGADSCGDVICVRYLTDERLAIVVGDGACEAARPARSATLATEIVDLLAMEAQPGIALQFADRELRERDPHEGLSPARFFVGVADARTSTLAFACAGHETAILFYADGSFRQLHYDGPRAGLSEAADYRTVVEPFAAHETLVVVTNSVSASYRDEPPSFGACGIVRSVFGALASIGDPARTIVEDSLRRVRTSVDDRAAVVVTQTKSSG